MRLSLRTLVVALPALLLAAEGSAQDLCEGLVTDKAPHPMTALAKPAVGKAVTDPQFGTKIRRLTAAPSGGAIRPMYSTISAWNADETRLILYRVGSGHQLYDGKTYAFIRGLDINPADLEQVYWDTSDPDLLYYMDNYFGSYPHQKSFVRYRVSTGAKEALRTFSCSGDISGGSDPMYTAWDKRRIGLKCDSQHFIYDFGTNTIVKSKTISGGYNAAQMAPSGNLAFLDGKVLNTSLNTVRTLDLGNPWEHATLGKLANGNDGYFGVAFDEGSQSDVGTLVVHDMTNGSWRVVVGPATGYPYPPSGTHLSAMAHKRRGWVTASIIGYQADGQTLLDNELLLVNTASSGGKVCRVAHHRSYGKLGSMGYWAEPHAVPSPSGTRILFASDWGNSGRVDAYVVELPSYGASASPFGEVDTPVNGASGLAGSVAITGWALDDTGVDKVEIWRDPVGGEPTAPNGKVYIGDATFVRGTRPDVESAYPGYPSNDRAGWGLLILTNFLPGEGNGTFTLHAYAEDTAGQSALLGSRTVSVDNASATLPFGTLDTPASGETISGDAYVVWGWALTPMPAAIPTSGSTIWLYVDGVPFGNPVYNVYREDIANGFPGYANSGGAVGYLTLDTTTLANGIHEISWSVTDDTGAVQGIGSRYFWVSN